MNASYEPFTAPHSLADIAGYTPRRLNPSVRDRHAHVNRLFELVVHLCTAPAPSHDDEAANERAIRITRAWRALCSCNEFDADAAWRLGLLVIEKSRLAHESDEDVGDRQAKWISHCREHRLDRVPKFVEYVLCLAKAGRHREALDELEALLPSHPYNDSVQLNVLAGQLCLYIAQPDSDDDMFEDEDEQDARASSMGPSQSQRRRRKRRRFNFDPDSSSSSHSSGESNAEAKRASAQQAQEDANQEEKDLLDVLRRIELNNGQLFDRAKDHFAHARELEHEDVETSNGQGARWHDLLSSVDDTEAMPATGVNLPPLSPSVPSSD